LQLFVKVFLNEQDKSSMGKPVRMNHAI